MTDQTVSFIAVVPARLASTRLPGKMLAELNGRPLVIHTAERARESGAHQVLIATDAQEILDVADRYGIPAVLTRTDHMSGTDRIAEVATSMGWNDQQIVVNVQGDEPLIDAQLIRQVAAHLHAMPDCAMATAACALTEAADVFDPNIVKAVLDAKGRALYFSRAPIPWARAAYTNAFRHNDAHGTDRASSANAAHPTYRHIGLYAYRAGFLRAYPALTPAPIEQIEALEQLRALWHGERIAVLITQSTIAPGVDTPVDLERVRAAINHSLPQGKR